MAPKCGADEDAAVFARASARGLAGAQPAAYKWGAAPEETPARLGRGDDKVGNPHRTQIYRFELFELILLLELDKQFPVEQVEATVSQSTVPSPPS